MKYLHLFIFLFFSNSFAHAEYLPNVVYFAGYGSSKEQADEWKTAAQKDPNYGHEFHFYSVPFHSKSSLQSVVIRDSEATIEKWVKYIDDHPDQEFILAGHSSGSAVSNEIARRIKKRKKHQVKLVVLDGFTPRNIPDSIDRTCWSAVSAEDPSRQSLNTRTMRSCRKYAEITSTGCKTAMCLHFSLINSNSARVPVTPSNYKKDGYLHLHLNLTWLDSDVKKTDHSVPGANKSPDIAR